MKKIIALVMCVAMLLSVSVFSVNTSAETLGKISLTTTAKITDPVSGTGTLTVTINITENTGVNTLVFDLGYNSDTLRLVSVTNGTVFTTDNGCSNIFKTDINPIRLLFENSGIDNISETGKLAVVKFDIIDDMGNFDITGTVDPVNTYAASGTVKPVDVDISFSNNITKNTQHISTGLPVTIKATCTEPGRIEKRCINCNKLLSSVENGEALGHDWDEIDRVEPTVYSDGYVEYECLRCPETKKEVLPQIKTDPAFLSGTYKIEDDKLTLTLNLTKNPGINTLHTRLGYNAEALELVSVTNGSVFSAANNASMFDINYDANPLSLYFDENGVGNIKTNGTLAILEFTIIDSEADFGFELEVDDKNTIAAAEGYIPYNVKVNAGEIAEMSFIPGDIDGDGKVNAVDMNLIKQIVIDIYTPDAAEFAAADLNGDGKVNATDANMLKMLVVGLDIN